MNNHAIGPQDGYPGTFLPYKLEKLTSFGITPKIAKISKISKPRKISYMNGIMMTSGLNKGLMIKTILNKTNTKFKAIVFSDDHIKHTKRVQAVMSAVQGIELVTYRYGKIDPQVIAFKKSNKKNVINAFDSYRSTMRKIFK